MDEHKYPSMLELHPGTSCCGLDCVFCYRKGRAYCTNKPRVNEARLIKLIDEFAELGGRDLFISGGTEPFSQPRIACLAISRGQQAGLRVRVYTNGIAPALQEASTRNLLALTEQVRFSIHAIDPHTYRHITRSVDRNVSLLKVFNNVVGVMNARPATCGTKVGIGLIVLTENVDDLTEAGKFWRDVGADFLDIRYDVIAGTNPDIGKRVKSFLSLAESGYFDPLKVSIASYAHGKPRLASRCYAPFEKLVVDPFGFVWCCCLLSQPGQRPPWAKVGDLESQSLSQIAAHLEERFPREHCHCCTPWEAKHNLESEQAGHSKKVNESTFNHAVTRRL